MDDYETALSVCKAYGEGQYRMYLELETLSKQVNSLIDYIETTSQDQIDYQEANIALFTECSDDQINALVEATNIIPLIDLLNADTEFNKLCERLSGNE